MQIQIADFGEVARVEVAVAPAACVALGVGGPGDVFDSERLEEVLPGELEFGFVDSGSNNAREDVVAWGCNSRISCRGRTSWADWWRTSAIPNRGRICSSSCSPGRKPQSRPDCMERRSATVIFCFWGSGVVLGRAALGKKDSIVWSVFRKPLSTAMPVIAAVMLLVMEATSCGEAAL